MLHFQDIFLQKTYTPHPCDDFLTQCYENNLKGKKYITKQSYLVVTLVDGFLRDYSLSRVSKGPKKVEEEKTADMTDKMLALEMQLERGGIKLNAIRNSITVGKIMDAHYSAYEDGVFKDLTFSANDILLGENTKVGFLSLDSDECLPLELYPAALNKDFSQKSNIYSDRMACLGVGFAHDHVVNTMIYIPDQKKTKAHMEQMSKRMNSLSSFGRENIEMKQANDAFLEETYKDKGKLIVYAHVNVMYWSNHDDKYKRMGIELKNIMRENGMIAHEINKFTQKTLFLSSIIGNASTLAQDLWFMTHAEIASSLVVKESLHSVQDRKTLGLVTTDRLTGIPKVRDSWFVPYQTKTITNRNSCKIGQSGGGKTVNVINDLYQYWLMDFNITCIDIGRSLEVITKYLNGNYVIYKEGMSLGINPFEISDGILNPDKLDFLCSFIYILWDAAHEPTPIEEATLKLILVRFYGGNKTDNGAAYFVDENGKNATFSDFYVWVLEHSTECMEIAKGDKYFFNVDKFSIGMEQYHSGIYSNLFKVGSDNVPEIDYKKRFTVWELDNIMDNKVLFPIFAMLITYLTTQVMWKEVTQNKFFWFEEGWRTVKKPGMANFFIYLLKTIRKFDGGFGVSIQELGDMKVENSNIFEVFKSNTKVWDFTIQSVPEAETIAKELGWVNDQRPTDVKLELLKSIGNDLNCKYPYFERLNIIGSDAQVVRTMLSFEQVATFMSDLSDKQVLFGCVDECGGKWQEGITLYADRMRDKRAKKMAMNNKDN